MQAATSLLYGADRARESLVLRLLVGLAGLAAALLIWTSAGGPTPRYTPDGELVLPEGVEQWVAVGSSIGLGYSVAEVQSGAETFHSVFLEPGAYASHRNSGRFPDGTMLALVIRSPAPRVAPAQGGTVAGALVGIELAVKDTARFAGGWGYFDFGRRGAGASARPFPPERCARCHADHADRDNVFVQFYPVLQAR